MRFWHCGEPGSLDPAVATRTRATQSSQLESPSAATASDRKCTHRGRHHAQRRTCGAAHCGNIASDGRHPRTRIPAARAIGDAGRVRTRRRLGLHHRPPRARCALGRSSTAAAGDPAARPQTGAHRDAGAGIRAGRPVPGDAALPHRCDQYPRPARQSLPERGDSAVRGSAECRTHAMERTAAGGRRSAGAAARSRVRQRLAAMAAGAAGRPLHRSQAGAGGAGGRVLPPGPRRRCCCRRRRASPRRCAN